VLKAYFLGDFRVVTADGRELHFTTKRARALFAYLQLKRGQWLNRESIPEDVWGGCHGDAKKALRNKLSLIIREVERVGLKPDDYIEKQDGCVRATNSNLVKLDIANFESLVASSENQPTTIPSDLYRGEFLPGFYEEWTHLPREIFRQQFLILVEKEMQYFQENEQWDKAIIAANRLVHCDPFREASHRSLMLLHYYSGNRGAAIQQFGRCRDLLRAELQIDPMAETIDLHQSIVRGDVPEFRKSSDHFLTSSADKGLISTSLHRQLIATRDVIDQFLQTAAPN